MLQQTSDGFRRGLILIDRFYSAHGGDFRDRLDSSELEVQCQHVGDLDLESLVELAKAGHHVVLSIKAGFQAQVDISPPGTFDGRLASGDLISSLGGEVLEEAESALHEERFDDFVRSCSELPGSALINLRVHPEQTGFHWVRTSAALLSELDQHWWNAVQALFAYPGVRLLMINDSGSDWLRADDLLVFGPDAEVPSTTGMDPSEWDAYRRAWLSDNRSRFPSGKALHPQSNQGMEPLARKLGRASHALSWLWLATSATITADSLSLLFQYASYMALDMTNLPPLEGSAEALALADWAAASADHLRHDAVQQAIASVISEPHQFYTGAPRVLRTAQLLLRLAQSGVVAEAIAARRTALQSATAAARSSSDAARTAARSSADRAFAEIAGGVGIVLAKASSLINSPVAHGLIVLVAALTLVTAVIAFMFDFPAASNTLTSFESDLTFDAMLTEHDISDVKGLQALSDARNDVLRARISTGVLVGAVAIGLVVEWLGVN